MSGFYEVAKTTICLLIGHALLP